MDSYKEELLKLDKLREKFSWYSKTIFYFWITIFLAFFISWFLKNILGVAEPDIGFSLSSLNSMGGTFNILTALTGVATVWLLSEATANQKEELIKIKRQMQIQQSSSEKEGATNRAIDMINQWNEVREINKENDYLLTDNEKKFINRVFYLYSKDTKNIINFTLISKFLRNDGVEKKLQHEIKKLNDKIYMKDLIFDENMSAEERRVFGLPNVDEILLKIENNRPEEKDFDGESQDDYDNFQSELEYYASVTNREIYEERIENEKNAIESKKEPLEKILNIILESSKD